MQEFLNLLIEYSYAIIPGFLFALLISAVLAEAINQDFFEKVLGSKKAISVFMSSVVGALIPLCTCGMIPLASKIQQKGASWLTTLSFLTAGNACSITALILTFVLGLKVTLLRFLFAVIYGVAVSYIFTLFFKPKSKLKDCLKEESHSGEIYKRITKEFKELVFSYGPWVFCAIFVAAIINKFLSVENVTQFVGSENFYSPFLLPLATFPFYFCAGADVPIAKALLIKGASLGSVLSLMTAAPGINITSLIVYQKWLGLKSAIIYLLISLLICGIMGIVLNIFL